MKKLLILLIFLFAVPGWAAIYYVKDIGEALPYYEVDASCDDVTIADDTADIQDILTAGSTNDTLHLCAGTFSATELDADGAFLIPDDGWTIQGEGDTSILDFSGGAGHTLQTNDKDNITLKDFKALAGGVAAYPIKVKSGSTGVTIDNVTVDNANNYNIWILGGTNITVKNCTLTGTATTQRLIAGDTDGDNTAGSGMLFQNNTLSGADDGIHIVTNPDGSERIQNVSILDNDIQNIVQFPIYLGAYITTGEIARNSISNHLGTGSWGRGIELYSSSDTYYVSAINIHHNTVDGIVDPNADDADGVCIGADDNSDDIDIHHNIVSSCEGKGIASNIATNVDIYNNIVIESGEDGIGANAADRSGLRCGGASTCNIFNNTVYGGENKGIDIHNTSTAVVENNTVFSSGSLTYGVACKTDGGCGASTVDYNNIVAETDDDYFISQGANGISSDPLFANAANNDFRLSWGSPAIDTGDTLSIHADGWESFYKDRRGCGAAFDIGADEFCHQSHPSALMIMDIGNKSVAWTP